MDESHHKRCARCGCLKPLTAFYRVYANDDTRFHSRCIPCIRETRQRVTPAQRPLPGYAVDAGFGNWLAGFIDGEGCFQICTSPTTYCALDISLRWDDKPILEDIQRRTGLGRVADLKQRGNDAPAVRWTVKRRDDCMALVVLLECHPLRAKKARDFEIWAKAVRAWYANGRRWVRQSGLWDELQDRREQLIAVRRA